MPLAPPLTTLRSFDIKFFFIYKNFIFVEGEVCHIPGLLLRPGDTVWRTERPSMPPGHFLALQTAQNRPVTSQTA